jgi:hypothetical protein
LFHKGREFILAEEQLLTSQERLFHGFNYLVEEDVSLHWFLGNIWYEHPPH